MDVPFLFCTSGGLEGEFSLHRGVDGSILEIVGTLGSTIHRDWKGIYLS